MEEYSCTYDYITLFERNNHLFLLDESNQCHYVPPYDRDNFLPKWENRDAAPKREIIPHPDASALRNLHIQLGAVFNGGKPERTTIVEEYLSNEEQAKNFLDALTQIAAYDINIIAECKTENHLKRMRELFSLLYQYFENSFFPNFMIVLPAELSGDDYLAVLKKEKSPKHKKGLIKAVSAFISSEDIFSKYDFTNDLTDIFIFELPDMVLRSEFVDIIREHREKMFLLKINLNDTEYKSKLTTISYKLRNESNFALWGHNFYRLFSSFRHFRLPKLRFESRPCGFTRLAIRHDLSIFPSLDHLEMNCGGLKIEGDDLRLFSNKRIWWPEKELHNWKNDRKKCQTDCHLWRWCCACLKQQTCRLTRCIFEGLFMRIVDEYLAD